jgi:hypothetical protein
MAFTASGLRCLVPGVGSGNAIFVYQSAEAHGDVDAIDFFTDGVQYGMKAQDIVIVIDTATPTITLHRVSAVDADGNATIGASGA